MPFTWMSATRPFVNENGAEPARFVLEQVADAKFRLREPFRYEPPGGESIAVTDDALGDTDFASIPPYMTWFVNRTGRHTAAALVHDQLVTRDMPTAERVEADRTFLTAMDELEVPPVRGRVMWTATVLATRISARPWGLLGIIVWGVCAVTGTWLLVNGIADGNWGAVALALLGPLVTCPLWGRQYWAGVVGGYALWVVAVPALSALGAYYLVYWPIEQLVRFGRKLIPANRHEELPGPTTYKAA